MKIGKEQERVGFAVLFAHKQQRNVRREQQGGEQHFGTVASRQLNQALAPGAVADLIVVLDKIDERDRRLAGAVHAARLAALW